MKKLLTSFMLSMFCVVATVSVANADLLYSDDFTGPVGPYNGNTTPNSPIGVPSLESYGGNINANLISDGMNTFLSLEDGGGGAHEGLSFGGTAGRFNWATSSAATQIAAGGMTVSFDVTADNGGSFVSMGFGSFTGVPDGGAGFGAIYDSSDMDWGIRWENDRMITFAGDGTTTPVYRTDTMPGGYNVGNGTAFNVLLELQFGPGGFDAGTVVTASSTVTNLDTLAVVSDLQGFTTFTLGATDNFVFDFSSNNANGNLLVDNLAINSIPEPSSIALLSLAGVAMVVRRRR